MLFVLMGILFGATIMTGTVTSQLITENYVTRLNYGVAVVRVNQVCAATGYVTYIFHLPLPRRGTPISRPGSDNATGCVTRCQLMEPLETAVRRMTNSLRAAVTNLVTKSYRK